MSMFVQRSLGSVAVARESVGLLASLTSRLPAGISMTVIMAALVLVARILVKTKQGYRTRRALKRASVCATKIQACWRSGQRWKIATDARAAQRIQTALRCFHHRRHYRATRAAVGVIRNGWFGHQARTLARHRLGAARFISAAYRGHLQRRRLCQRHCAAKKIQCWWRQGATLRNLGRRRNAALKADPWGSTPSSTPTVASLVQYFSLITPRTTTTDEAVAESAAASPVRRSEEQADITLQPMISVPKRLLLPLLMAVAEHEHRVALAGA